MIRAASIRDLDTLESIERASFGPDAWTAMQIGDELHGDRIVLAHVDEFGVQGFASIRVFAPDAELMRIAVGLGSRREGVGSRLLAAVEDAARNRGAERLLLELKGKFAEVINTGGSAPVSDTGADVLRALLALGYSDKEATLAIKNLPAGVSVPEGIKLALKSHQKS